MSLGNLGCGGFIKAVLGSEQDLDVKEASMRVLKDSRKGLMGLAGYEKTDSHVTVPLHRSGTLSTTVPIKEKNLLPDARIQPLVGVGKGGVQVRLKINRGSKGVPKGSVIGAGLANQTSSSGADISVKTASVDQVLKRLGPQGTSAAIGAAAGGGLGLASGDSVGDSLYRGVVGGTAGGLAGSKIQALVQKNPSLKQRMGQFFDEASQWAKG